MVLNGLVLAVCLQLDGVTAENSAVVAHIFEMIPKIAAADGLGQQLGHDAVFAVLRRADVALGLVEEDVCIAAIGQQVAVKDDDRITPVGKVIRACRMDEWPQLINILKGDMSIVGPRCECVENVEKYTEEIPEFAYRHKVKAGLTGYAQIYGKYNTTAYDKLKLDLYYIENYSIRTDIRLIFMTVKVLFMRESTEEFVEPTKTESTEEKIEEK